MTVTNNVRVGGLNVRVVTPTTTTLRGAVVMVHGVCLSGRVWHRWAERLALRGIEAWCVDLRGHGDSDGSDQVGNFRITDYADDVQAVVEASGAVAVIGHEMGGLVAQVVATRTVLKGTVLVSSVAPKGISGRSSMQLLWREFRPTYIRALLRGKAWRPANEDARHLLCTKLPAEDQDEVMSWLTNESGTAAREMLFTGVNIDEGELRSPVFVVAATHDELTPPQRQRLIAQKYHADYVEFAAHGHFPMLEPGHERSISVIGRWLEEVARMGDRTSVQRIAARRAGDTPTPLPVTIVGARASGVIPSPGAAHNSNTNDPNDRVREVAGAIGPVAVAVKIHGGQ